MQKYTEYDILKKYDHEKLFALAGFEVSNYEVLNPLRDDSTPGCFFEYYNGVLYFYDFTYFFGKAGINGVRAIKEAYGIDSLEEVVEVIEEGYDEVKVRRIKQKPVSEVRVEVVKKDWGKNNYFTRYGKELTPEVLEREGIYLVDSYRASSRKFPSLIPNLIGDPKTMLTIAYNKEDRYKIYRPFDTKVKWYGNIRSTDVWGLDSLSGWSNSCYIVGSVKDYLVLKYVLGVNNCIGLQSENPILPKNVEEKLQNKKKYIIFDLDETGVKNSLELSRRYPNTFPIKLPNLTDRYGRSVGKDISDIVEILGKEAIKLI